MNMTNCRRADEILSTLFNGSIDNEKLQQTVNLNKGWASIVGSISSSKQEGNKLGQFLVAHTRIIDLSNGTLLIEVDHPGYIQTIQMYNRYILKGLKMKYPELEVRTIACRLKNTDVHLQNNDALEEEKAETSQPDGEIQDEQTAEAKGDIEISPELKAAVDRLKATYKKNSQNLDQTT